MSAAEERESAENKSGIKKIAEEGSFVTVDSEQDEAKRDNFLFIF